ncbi:MAG: hypothetical protein AAF497_17265, partial [Planctomycetota bacterium]
WSFVRTPGIADLVWIFPIAWHCGVAVIGFAIMLLWNRRSGSESDEVRPDPWVMLSMVFGCFALTLFIAWNLTRIDLTRLFFRRYLVVVSILPMLFTGLLLGRMKWRWQVLVGIITVALVVYHGPYRTWHKHGELALRANEDWRGAIERLSQEQPQLLVVDSRLIECDRLSADSSAAFREYCTLPVRGLYQLADESECKIVAIRRTDPSGDLAELLKSHQGIERAWIITRGRQDWAELLGNQGIRSRQVAEFGAISLVRILGN